MKQKFVMTFFTIFMFLYNGCMACQAAESDLDTPAVNFIAEFQEDLSENDISGIELYAEIVDLSSLSGVNEIPEDFKIPYNKEMIEDRETELANNSLNDGDIGDNNGYSLYLTDINNWETSLTTKQTQVISLRASLINSYSDEYFFELEGDCINVDLTGKDSNNIYTGKYTFVKLEPGKEKNVIIKAFINSNSVIPDVNMAEVDQSDKDIVSGIQSGDLSYHEIETEEDTELEYNYNTIKEALVDRDKNNENIKLNEQKKTTIIILCLIGSLTICIGYIVYRKIKKIREDD